MTYESYKTINSASSPGVTFKLRRMSVERRLGLTRRLRELLQRIEFLESGDDPRESMEAALLAAEVNQVYLLWGLAEISGLEIDGQAATPETLIAAGPEDLCREIISAIKAECGLSEDERKN
jgi:hypothetical protein